MRSRRSRRSSARRKKKLSRSRKKSPGVHRRRCRASRRRSRAVRRRSRRVRRFRVARGPDHVEELSKRQVAGLQDAVSEMLEGKKEGHWAWWAWPCNRKGPSEARLMQSSTYIANQEEAERLVKLEGACVWGPILSITAEALRKNGREAIPEIDHSRIEQFCDEWAGYLAGSQKLQASPMLEPIFDFISAWQAATKLEDS